MMQKQVEMAYRAEREHMLRYAERHVNREEAEDILHDVFINALRSLDSMEPIHNVAAWLFTALKILIVLGMIVLAVGFTFLFGLIVMLLWNWLMRDIFGLPRIDYWHAWGLVLLSHILFKSWGGRRWGPKRSMGRDRFGRDSSEGEKEPAPTGEA